VFKDILALKESLEREVLPRFSTRRQDNAQLLIKTLYQQPVIDIRSATQLLSVETNTATYLINDLVKYGILEEMTGKRRNRVFWFKEYLMIFRRDY
jgi:Fic family protein